jgi:hypothetical protein
MVRRHQRLHFWSGACGSFRPKNATVSNISVHRRPNGTIRPLSTSDVKKVFGDFSFSETSPRGAVAIDPAWTDKHIVTLKTPVLESIGTQSIQVHKKAEEPFSRVFDAIKTAGLDNRIVTYAGTFVTRHKGWDPSRSLSPHSWGIAIDINVQWNAYGAVPAALGKIGCVRELVPLFEAEGFAWGGYFEPQIYADGMHFELARLDL